MLGNPNVQDLAYKSLQFIPILTQMFPVHVLQSCFFKILLNIILSPTPMTSKQSFHYAPIQSKPLISGLTSHDCGVFQLNLRSSITSKENFREIRKNLHPWLNLVNI
jgi:hypothetical protein